MWTSPIESMQEKQRSPLTTKHATLSHNNTVCKQGPSVKKTREMCLDLFSLSRSLSCAGYIGSGSVRAWEWRPAVLGRKFSGRSMWRIRAGFGAQRPGSEQYSQRDLGRARGESRGGRKRRARGARLTWNCQEAERGADRLGTKWSGQGLH